MKTTRREFMKTAGAGALGATLIPAIVGSQVREWLYSTWIPAFFIALKKIACCFFTTAGALGSSTTPCAAFK